MFTDENLDAPIDLTIAESLWKKNGENGVRRHEARKIKGASVIPWVKAGKENGVRQQKMTNESHASQGENG